jgi:hypothetical protein
MKFAEVKVGQTYVYMPPGMLVDVRAATFIEEMNADTAARQAEWEKEWAEQERVEQERVREERVTVTAARQAQRERLNERLREYGVTELTTLENLDTVEELVRRIEEAAT